MHFLLQHLGTSRTRACFQPVNVTINLITLLRDLISNLLCKWCCLRQGIDSLQRLTDDLNAPWTLIGTVLNFDDFRHMLVCLFILTFYLPWLLFYDTDFDFYNRIFGSFLEISDSWSYRLLWEWDVQSHLSLLLSKIFAKASRDVFWAVGLVVRIHTLLGRISLSRDLWFDETLKERFRLASRGWVAVCVVGVCCKVRVAATCWWLVDWIFTAAVYIIFTTADTAAVDDQNSWLLGRLFGSLFNRCRSWTSIFNSFLSLMFFGRWASDLHRCMRSLRGWYLWLSARLQLRGAVRPVVT